MFQFPTGWNSTLAGFVLRKVVFRFQFPTGWNSTDFEREQMELQKAFQFPTGWNSTIKDMLCEYLSKSFNSQRDGILLRAKRNTRHLSIVSIPNGMEFYIDIVSLLLLSTLCFNSQRDGILQVFQYIRTFEPQFQFPTGWNSTENMEISDIKPSGFNSQRDGILPRFLAIKDISKNCFNSQRDGILPWLR